MNHSRFENRLRRNEYYKSVDIKKYNHIKELLDNEKLIGQSVKINSLSSEHRYKFDEFNDMIVTCRHVNSESSKVQIPHIGTYYTYYDTYLLTLLQGSNIQGTIFKYLYLHIVDYTTYPKHDFYIFSRITTREELLSKFMNANCYVNFHELLDLKSKKKRM